MEFFERAHVARNKATKRKESKSEKTVKKQLKQMLRGYKQSDNELIMKSMDIKRDTINEDSSSVSGFSDLNITNSSNNDTTTEMNFDCHVGQDTLKSDDSTSDINVISASISDTSDIHSLIDSNTSNQNFETNEHYTDQYNDPDKSENESTKSIDLDSDSNDISLSSQSFSPEIRNITLSDISEDFMTVSSTETAEFDSDTLEPFDADGRLASKIHEKLKNDKTIMKLKGDRKRKSNIFKEYTDDSSEAPILSSELEDKSHKRPVTCDDEDPIYTEDCLMSDEISYKDSIIDSSLPFVLVTADETCNQSLSDILGDYRYPTIRNISSNSLNVSLPINCATKSVGDNEVHIKEAKDDNDSITPKLIQDQTLNDVEHVISNSDDSTQPKEESSDLYDTLQLEQTFERESSQESMNTNFLSPVKVFYGKNKCIIILKHPAEIFIHGKVKISALGGTVETFGWRLKNKPYELYAPYYNYAQVIKTVEYQNAYYGLFAKLTSAGLSVAEAEEIVTMIGENDGIITLQQLNSKKIDFVESNFTVTSLFNKQAKYIDVSLKKASEDLGCSIYLNRPWKCFDENPIWKEVLKCGENKASRGIVCGGKGTGKSTFLRYYINKLVERGPVLVVDLDPGQCEFTVAGNLSATVVSEPLLGPNFTHLKTPDRMLNIGMINIMDNPRRYAVAMENLIAYCHNNKRFQDMPWIVNTMGMCNTLGHKFIALCILCTEPTFLLQIDSRNAKTRFATHLNSQTIRRLYFEDYQHDPLFRNVVCSDYLDYSFFLTEHPDIFVKNNSLAPKDERYLNFLAYFGELLNVHNGMNLLAIIPYEVPLQALKIGLNVKINEDALAKVINGKVVALCQLDTHQQVTPDNRRRMFTLADKPLLCHGHGLVRGIEGETLYIVTPAPAERVSLVDTLVYADWAPELCGPKTQPAGSAPVPVPYRTAARYHRQLMFTPRRRFNPLQLLKMTRNA